MITIDYMSYSKKNGRWQDAEKEFKSISGAVRFCWSMKNNPDLFLKGFICDDPMDSEIMSHKVNLTAINGY